MPVPTTPPPTPTPSMDISFGVFRVRAHNMIKTVNCDHFGSYCHCDMMTLGLYKIYFLIIEEFLAWASLQHYSVLLLFCQMLLQLLAMWILYLVIRRFQCEAIDLFGLEIVEQINISPFLVVSVDGCSLKVLLNFSVVQTTR